jgi:pimeloyl-ACP methyl ester carboxylesterase
MIQDFQSSGLIDQGARNFRVIAFDRPGYGYSTRPRTTLWTPQAQADLIREALAQLDVTDAIIVGHSWGSLVALALAIQHPEVVRAVLPASGYYYPTPRLDVWFLSIPALPIVGGLIAHTVAPLISRLMWPLLMRNIFGPCEMPEKFLGFPKALAVRPSQLRASAAESALMVPSAAALALAYGELKLPVAIVAGKQDRVVHAAQSAELHRHIPGSLLVQLPEIGHMVHQSATRDLLSAIQAL